MGDPWSEWHKTRRHGGDAGALEEARRFVAPIRERVLEGARIQPGNTVLDAGCGDGLIAFGALQLVGDDGAVIFDDISEELLDVCRQIADGDPRCRFVNAPVTNLPLADESVDVVTLRSVAIYVPDKQRAFDEVFRVLKPGGRLSLFEPVNSFGYPEADDRFFGVRVPDELRDASERVKSVWRSIDLPEYRAMHDWVERDLVSWVERAGFSRIVYDVRYDVKPADVVANYDVRIRQAGNPLIPTLDEALDQALSHEERQRFEAWLRPRAEAGDGVWRMAHGYLVATK
jgi:SAM-dependent methyltransferase